MINYNVFIFDFVHVVGIIYFFYFFFIFLEFLYSKYKNDGVHNTFGTINNFLNGLFLKYIFGPISIVFFYYLTTLSFKNEQPGQVTYVSFLINILICLVIFDFFWYLYHRAHHRFDFLWMFHHVHHGDDHVNLSTQFRVSFVEKITYAFIAIPVILLGFHKYEILIALNIQGLYTFWSHCQYVKLPKIFNIALITPQAHLIHHDQNHMNKNYGAIFSFWDKLFGTYSSKIDKLEIGIDGYHQNNIIKFQTDPIIKYFKNHVTKLS